MLRIPHSESQGGLLHSLLARLDALSLPPASPSSQALAMMAAPTNASASSLVGAASGPPMIVGGPQPVGYVLAGQNQGMPWWVEVSLLTASIMSPASDPAIGPVSGASCAQSSAP